MEGHACRVRFFPFPARQARPSFGKRRFARQGMPETRALRFSQNFQSDNRNCPLGGLQEKASMKFDRTNNCNAAPAGIFFLKGNCIGQF